MPLTSHERQQLDSLVSSLGIQKDGTRQSVNIRLGEFAAIRAGELDSIWIDYGHGGEDDGIQVDCTNVDSIERTYRRQWSTAYPELIEGES